MLTSRWRGRRIALRFACTIGAPQLGRYERQNIKIGLAMESEVNREFIEAWHKAEKEEIELPEERLYFM